MDDLISRQAAIDAILAVTGNSSVRELYEHVQEHGLSDMWSGGVNAAIDVIIAVPSAQSEPCDLCSNLEKGDTLYQYSDWDGGIGFDYIHNIKFCPMCGRML